MTGFRHVCVPILPIQPKNLHIPLLHICWHLFICHVQVHSQDSCEQCNCIPCITALHIDTKILPKQAFWDTGICIYCVLLTMARQSLSAKCTETKSLPE